MRDYKIVVLGAGGVGKSALSVQFVQGVYIESYDPTIEDSYRKVTEIDQRPCTLEILDTAGVEQFTAMRELYIKNGQGFILVYSVNNKDSLRELLELREQIIRIKDNANVPMVLVANKSDLEAERQVSPEMGVQVANSWGRTPFYETSAKYRLNVDEVFTDLVRQIMRRDSAFGGSVAPSLRSHSFQNSLDEGYNLAAAAQYYGHHKRVSASSNHSSVSGISTNTVNNQYSSGYYNISATNTNTNAPNTVHHASSMFKLKSKSKSKEHLPRYQAPSSPQQELTQTQLQQLRYMEQQQQQQQQQQMQQHLQPSHVTYELDHKLSSKLSRQFKKPQPSKSMPALRKSKRSGILAGKDKDKDCIIC